MPLMSERERSEGTMISPAARSDICDEAPYAVGSTVLEAGVRDIGYGAPYALGISPIDEAAARRPLPAIPWALASIERS
eukprot:CAMPEP_0185597522 /NCGR_PEP_ID=MMETSP0434-20130131/81421_1 /TAXON_ID=626734 ORGANISM="Favella taraikaensis, Strain Fe Narragansett Bay" /NCGR_SAMPLE_ID=MMETSP0434 /ASSEMBLY_ACC=CAM_ASM_000379 /LENGTH=78 /DNA_ID=CAMNT_0028226267 /DNA_START=488 /DNA_END=724 /DNA_ORIENTATION=+